MLPLLPLLLLLLSSRFLLLSPFFFCFFLLAFSSVFFLTFFLFRAFSASSLLLSSCSMRLSFLSPLYFLSLPLSFVFPFPSQFPRCLGLFPSSFLPVFFFIVLFCLDPMGGRSTLTSPLLRGYSSIKGCSGGYRERCGKINLAVNLNRVYLVFRPSGRRPIGFRSPRRRATYCAGQRVQLRHAASGGKLYGRARRREKTGPAAGT